MDDDQKIKELISQYLIEQDFIVTTAESSAEAKDRMELFSFDLIILDIMMPGQDGLDLTKEIRLKSDQPIILLTAKGEEFLKACSILFFCVSKSSLLNSLPFDPKNNSFSLPSSSPFF